MHPSAYSFIASLVEKITPYGVVRSRTGIDIGGRDVNGNAREMFHHTVWDVLDRKDGEDVTIQADAAAWIPRQVYDIVVCTEVLEHSPLWEDIVRTCVKCLDRNGHFVLTCAATGRGQHGEDGNTLPPGEYYGNIDPYRLLLVLTEFRGLIWRSFTYDPSCGDVYFYGVRGW
jgi:hypothetical protein